MGAIAVADLVKSTLGQKGMDKILQPMSGRAETIVFTLQTMELQYKTVYTLIMVQLKF